MRSLPSLSLEIEWKVLMIWEFRKRLFQKIKSKLFKKCSDNDARNGGVSLSSKSEEIFKQNRKFVIVGFGLETLESKLWTLLAT